MIFSGNNFYFDLGKKTYIMGILNVTEDSFYDGGKYNSPEKALVHTKQMLNDGADIIDIGAYSTRPGHTVLSDEDELDIIRKYLPLIADETGAIISVDTFNPSVAEYALNNGAAIINDVSGVFNIKMAELVKSYNCGWIIMHTGGGNSSTKIDYKNGVVSDVNDFFASMLRQCEDFGIYKNQIALDIGIGFGKSYFDNLTLIKNIDKLKKSDVALLTALSSKRVIAATTDSSGEDLLYGTIAANSLAAYKGTDIIRVHNVRENAIAIKLCDALR